MIKQVGYTIADILAKPAYGMLIHSIAEEQMRAEGTERSKTVVAATGD